MKITNINGRVDKSSRHNDRNFDVSQSDHIHAERSIDNKYYTYDGDLSKSFLEKEKEFYSDHFSDFLEERNERCIKNRHPDRVITIDQYHRNDFSKPEEKILQIGNLNESASQDVLWEVTKEYIKRFNDLYGEHCQIVTAALHVDEATPHVHIKRVWMADDKNGNKYVSQTEALEQMDFTRPDMSKPEGRYNNAKMTFTKVDKSLFRSIALEHGIEIEKDNPGTKEHLSVLDFKKQERLREVNELSNTIEELTSVTRSLEDELDVLYQIVMNSAIIARQHEEELEAIKNKSKKEQMIAILKIYEQELEYLKNTSSGELSSIIADKELKQRLMATDRFIEKNGLKEEYESYLKSQLHRSVPIKEEGGRDV